MDKAKTIEDVHVWGIMELGDAIPKLSLPVLAPRGRGRPRLASRREAAEEVRAAVGEHLVKYAVPAAYMLMCEAIEQGRKWIREGKTPTREHMKAEQDAMRLAGFREPGKDGDRDLVDLSLAQLSAIIQEKEASLRVVNAAPTAQEIDKLM